MWGSAYDMRELLNASVKLMDGVSPLKKGLPAGLEKAGEMVIKKAEHTEIGELLRECGVLQHQRKNVRK